VLLKLVQIIPIQLSSKLYKIFGCKWPLSILCPRSTINMVDIFLRSEGNTGKPTRRVEPEVYADPIKVQNYLIIVPETTFEHSSSTHISPHT
jgi:hypothetical protein